MLCSAQLSEGEWHCAVPAGTVHASRSSLASEFQWNDTTAAHFCDSWMCTFLARAKQALRAAKLPPSCKQAGGLL